MYVYTVYISIQYIYKPNPPAAQTYIPVDASGNMSFNFIEGHVTGNREP
jgi:hypothetical protein